MVPVRLNCPRTSGGRCAGKLTISTGKKVRYKGKRQRVKLGLRRYSIPSGRNKIVKVRLVGAKRALVRRLRKLGVKVESVERGQHGPKTTTLTTKLAARR